MSAGSAETMTALPNPLPLSKSTRIIRFELFGNED